MQFGIKKESSKKIEVAIEGVKAQIEQLKEQLKDSWNPTREQLISELLQSTEFALNVLYDAQEGLDSVDFVLLDKEEYNAVKNII